MESGSCSLCKQARVSRNQAEVGWPDRDLSTTLLAQQPARVFSSKSPSLRNAVKHFDQ